MSPLQFEEETRLWIVRHEEPMIALRRKSGSAESKSAILDFDSKRCSARVVGPGVSGRLLWR